MKPEELLAQTALPEGVHGGAVSGFLYFAHKGKTSSIVGGTLWLRVMEDWSTSTPRPTTGSGVRVRSLGEMGST